jgi:hypothetical protein
MNWWKSPSTFPVRIFLVALFLRLIPVVVMRDMGIGLDDMYQYDMLARSIASGDGFRWYSEKDLPTVLPYLHLDLASVDYDPRGVLTSFRPPLYPTFLAIIYLIFGEGVRRFFVARMVQTVLAASLAPLTYFIARNLFPRNEKGARISAWIITVYPMLVIYPLSLATENLFFVLVLCSMLALLKAKRSSHPSINSKKTFISLILESRWFIISGFLLGLTCLTRSVAQIFALLAVAWIWFLLKDRRQAIIMVLAMVLVIGPWIIRNSLLYGRLTGIESAIGYDLYLGYHPQGSGTFQYPQSLVLMTMMNDSERDQVGIQKTLEFIKADPGRVFLLFLRRTGYFFGLERRALTYFYSNNYFGYIAGPVLGVIFGIFCLPFIIVSISAAVGLTLTKFSKEIWIMALFLVGYIVPHLLIISEDRFHLTIVPFLAILASQFWMGGLDAIRARWEESKNGKVAIILALVLIMLMLANWGLELWRDHDKLSLLFKSFGNLSRFSY